MCYEATITSAGGDEAMLAKYHIISLEGVAANWYSRLTKMHLFLSAIQREVLAKIPGFPSGAQHRGRFSVMHSA
jgi:hypothetical protein